MFVPMRAPLHDIAQLVPECLDLGSSGGDIPTCEFDRPVTRHRNHPFGEDEHVGDALLHRAWRFYERSD